MNDMSIVNAVLGVGKAVVKRVDEVRPKKLVPAIKPAETPIIKSKIVPEFFGRKLPFGIVERFFGSKFKEMTVCGDGAESGHGFGLIESAQTYMKTASDGKSEIVIRP